jgi:hypothetical protein
MWVEGIVGIGRPYQDLAAQIMIAALERHLSRCLRGGG